MQYAFIKNYRTKRMYYADYGGSKHKALVTNNITMFSSEYFQVNALPILNYSDANLTDNV